MKDYRDANGLPRVDTKSKAKTTTTPLGSEIDRLTRENLALNLLVDGRTQQADDLRAELKNSQEIAQKYEDRYFSANQENERLTRELAEAQKKLAYTIEQAADLALKLGSVMNHVHATDVSEFLASKNVYQELKESERQWEITASMLSEAEAALDAANQRIEKMRMALANPPSSIPDDGDLLTPIGYVRMGWIMASAAVEAALEGDAVWKPDICRGECRFCGREDCESHKPECPLAGEAALEDK